MWQLQQPTRRTERWRRGPAVLTAFGLGTSLAGLVALLPVILSPEQQQGLMPWLTYLVLVLTVAFVGIALFGGGVAQRLHVERLRFRMIRQRRRLARWAARFLTAERRIGMADAHVRARGTLDRDERRTLRRAYVWRRALGWVGADWAEIAWLRYQRVRNDYLEEVGRPRERIVETAGLVWLARCSYRLGYAEARSSDLTKEMIFQLDPGTTLDPEDVERAFDSEERMRARIDTDPLGKLLTAVRHSAELGIPLRDVDEWNTSRTTGL